MSERSFSQGPIPLVVAHRGASAELPENTLAAFERAVDRGADAIEFDVRLTSDGVPIVMHDPDVARTTDGSGPVRSMTAARLSDLRIDGEHPVPTLEDVLRALSGRIAVDIEIKNLPGEPDFDHEEQPVVDATLATLARTGFTGAVLLTSFNPLAIAHARTVAPEIPTGLLTDPRVEAHAALAYARDEGHPWVLPFIGMVLTAADGFAEQVHDAGLSLGTWLTDDPAEAVALMRAGVDAVATNDPAAVVDARRVAFGT
jgi:glycerophosphoryl diester phosphodiesterase